MEEEYTDSKSVDQDTTVALNVSETVALSHVSFSYNSVTDEAVLALNGVSFSLKTGSYCALLGRNGSGKSTVAKLIDVLEFPDSGVLFVKGLDTGKAENFWQIRKSCGMVFQNPDNQIVGTTVEEDVAFGSENLGIPSAEIRVRVDEALQYVGLEDLALRQPSQLSGGQKQKLAIAGILAMKPTILLLDESTSMLDPKSRDEFLTVVEQLVRENHMTVLHITHDMSEASRTDYIYVLDKGELAFQGTPAEVFSRVDRVRRLGLDVPVFADLAYEVAKSFEQELDQKNLYSRKKALAAIDIMIQRAKVATNQPSFPVEEDSLKPSDIDEKIDPATILEVNDLTFSYEKNGKAILKPMSFSIYAGEILAIIGHSGSGKTTLISHLNGLIRPQSGAVLYHSGNDGEILTTAKNSDLRKIRHHVGLLFQYPEYQLFEETVERDIAFGPKKMGMNPEEIKSAVLTAIEHVGLDESFLKRSPFELSGGQKRRVAFAGILAMNPDVLVLDEPAAGLDPVGRREIFSFINKLKAAGKTIILVSHNMDEAAAHADRLLVLQKGELKALETPAKLFSQPEIIAELGLALPEITTCMIELQQKYPGINADCFSVSQAVMELERLVANERRLL